MAVAGASKQVDPLQPAYTGGLGAAFRDGSPLANGVPITFPLLCAGLARGRFRFKATAAGTLSFSWLRADGVTPYTHAGSKPADIVVTANVEAVFEWDHYGEPFLLITYTPSGNGLITWADICRV